MKLFRIFYLVLILLPAGAYGKTYIMSPGNNQFYRISQLLQAGDSAIFDDGTYYESEMAKFVNSGTKDDPIVLVSRNRHKAVIIYEGANRQDIYITTEHITIRDFEITQDKKGTNTSNNIIRIYPPAANISIIGNKLHNAYEEAVKTHMVSNILVEGNLIYDFTNEGIDFTPAFNSVIRNNELFDIGRCAIMIKYNNARNVQIYNNYIHNRNVQMKNGGYAITLGGSSDTGSTPLQASNCVAWNNIIVSETPGLILYGVAFLDSQNCGFFNNVMIGVKTAFTSGGKASLTSGGKCMNNIIMNCENALASDKGYTTDYNLYYNTGNPPGEPHGIFNKDPMFVDPAANWHLRKGSPALKSGMKVIFPDYEGKTIDLSYDRDGMRRGARWDLGVYR
jgi:hypothetical protein